MTTKMYGLVFLTACCLIACCYSQDISKPKDANSGEVKVDELKDVLLSAGFLHSKSSINNNDMLDYVRFGSRSIATEYMKADQFDKIEMKKAMALHTTEIKSKRFTLSKLTAKLLERDDVETMGLFVQVQLPFRLRSHTRFIHDNSGFTGSLKMVNLSEINPYSYAFLKKDDSLQQCNGQEAAIVLKQNGVLYHPEIGNTLLVLNIQDKFDILRDLGKNLNSYNISLEIDNLRLDRPDTWGYYRQDSYKKNDMNCEQMQSNQFLKNEEKQPEYFITKLLLDSDSDKRPPEILISTIISLKVSKPDGTVIGSYINSKKTAPAPR